MAIIKKCCIDIVFQDRVPVILCKVIDQLYRDRTKWTEVQRTDIKEVVDKIVSSVKFSLMQRAHGSKNWDISGIL